MNESMYNHGLMIHNHDFFEITYILKGKGLYSQNRKTTPISEGDIVMVSPSDTHRFEPLTNDFHWINCIFQPQALGLDNKQPTLSELLTLDCDNENIPQEISHQIFLQRKGDIFKNLFFDMKKEYVKSSNGYQKIMNMQLRLLLMKISFAYSPKIQEDTSLGMTDEALRLLVQSFFKFSSLYSKITLEELAAKAHVTPKYFSELFKKKTGVSLSSYICELRIHRAAELLVSTDANIEEIMHYVGYNDSKFFYKSFKNMFGMTPAQYRKKMRLILIIIRASCLISLTYLLTEICIVCSTLICNYIIKNMFFLLGHYDYSGAL
jgi:two component transcriptional regulator, araC family